MAYDYSKNLKQKNQGSITNKVGVYSLTQNTGFMSTINVYYTTSNEQVLTSEVFDRGP